MFQLLILLLVFVGTAGVLYGGYIFVNRRAIAASEAAMERLQDSETANSSVNILLTENVSELPALDKLIAGQEWTRNLSHLLRASGSRVTPGFFLLRSSVIAMTAFVMLRLVVGGVLGPLIGLVVGGLLPITWLRLSIRRRHRLFQLQLPDAIDMLVNAMRAGYSFQASLKFIGEEIQAPLGPEFMRVYEEQRLGVEVRTALLALQRRVIDLDLRMFVTAVLIQRETGGNLSEILERIATLMRERAALKGEIEALTAESKLSARILAALPFFVLGALMLLQPGFIKPLTDSNYGSWVLVGAFLSISLGYMVMMQIANIDI